jgi:nitrogen regulatory protein PII
MKMIWAVVRSSRVEPIARELKKIGVSGCTVHPVRGYGEEWHLYEPLIHGGHHKLETVVADEQVDKAVKLISEHASTGIEGDGILCVLDLGSVVSIRSKEKKKNS